MKVSGLVDRVFEKPWKDARKGNIVLYSFKVKGNDKFYRLGDTKPSFRETDRVEFESDDNGRVTDLVVSKGNPTEAAPTSSSTSGETSRPNSGKSSSGSSREDYWNDKAVRDVEVIEPRISYAAARHDAVALVGIALQYDLLTFGNANKSAKLGLLQDYVDKVTLRFARQGLDAPDLINGVERDETSDDGDVVKNKEQGDLG
jgi:hypothetical protein